MTIFKLYKNWTHVSTLPLFRTLLVDGAIFYLVLALTFGLDIAAMMNDEVIRLHPLCLMHPHLRDIALLPSS